MSHENMTGKHHLGRRVVDNYGRTLGKVVGYYPGDGGLPPLLGVELVEGDFSTYPSTRLIDEANILVLDENWKTKAENLSLNLSIGMRKISALDRLYKGGEISHESYENLGKDFEMAVQDFRAYRESLVARLDERSKVLNVKLKEVEDYFVNIKVAHELGEVDDDAYRMSRDALHDLINRLEAEQKDIRAAQDTLQQASTPVQETLQRTEYPEQQREITKESPREIPIVLRIKEAEE